MPTPKLEQDLDFVRQVLDQSTPPAGVRSIYFFWAVAILIGMPLGDFRPQWMPYFWMTVGPGGWMISALLGYRASKQSGQMDRAMGLRQAAHWGAMVVVISLVALLPYKGVIAWEAMGPIVLLMLALMFALGYATLLFTPPYPWTIVGILGATGLFFSAYAEEPASAKAN